MAKVSKLNETAEAICSAFHRTGFEFLGDSHLGQDTWFHRGTKPHDIRVLVERDDKENAVKVRVEWRNLSNIEPVKGQQVFMVPVNYGDFTLQEASAQVVASVLGIYRDVLAGKGVAGPEALAGRDLGNRHGKVEHDGNEHG